MTGPEDRPTMTSYGDFGDGIPREVYADTGEPVPETAVPEPKRRFGCPECRFSRGTLHAKWCSRRDNGNNGYVSKDEAEPLEELPTAATAVVSLLDGEHIPEADPPDPLRRVELAAIWLAEAEAELKDAIVDARDGGKAYQEIADRLGVTHEAVRVRYMKAKQRWLDGRVV